MIKNERNSDATIRGWTYSWDSEPVVRQYPVRCLEDELVADVIPISDKVLCAHCTGPLAGNQGGRAMYCSALPCVAAAIRRRRALARADMDLSTVMKTKR